MSKKKWIGWSLTSIGVGLAVGTAVALWCGGCVGAPKSIDELEAMDDAAFESWSDRVQFAAQIAAGEMGDADTARVLAATLRALAGQPLSARTIMDAADAVGVSKPAALLLLSEIDAMIAHVGGWQGMGPRANALLEKIALGIESGSQEGN
jgi:hypothetical protein